MWPILKSLYEGFDNALNRWANRPLNEWNVLMLVGVVVVGLVVWMILYTHSHNQRRNIQTFGVVSIIVILVACAIFCVEEIFIYPDFRFSFIILLMLILPLLVIPFIFRLLRNQSPSLSLEHLNLRLFVIIGATLAVYVILYYFTLLKTSNAKYSNAKFPDKDATPVKLVLPIIAIDVSSSIANVDKYAEAATYALRLAFVKTPVPKPSEYSHIPMLSPYIIFYARYAEIYTPNYNDFENLYDDSKMKEVTELIRSKILEYGWKLSSREGGQLFAKGSGWDKIKEVLMKFQEEAKDNTQKPVRYTIYPIIILLTDGEITPDSISKNSINSCKNRFVNNRSFSTCEDILVYNLLRKAGTILKNLQTSTGWISMEPYFLISLFEPNMGDTAGRGGKSLGFLINNDNRYFMKKYLKYVKDSSNGRILVTFNDVRVDRILLRKIDIGQREGPIIILHNIINSKRLKGIDKVINSTIQISPLALVYNESIGMDKNFGCFPSGLECKNIRPLKDIDTRICSKDHFCVKSYFYYDQLKSHSVHIIHSIGDKNLEGYAKIERRNSKTSQYIYQYALRYMGFLGKKPKNHDSLIIQRIFANDTSDPYNRVFFSFDTIIVFDSIFYDMDIINKPFYINPTALANLTFINDENENKGEPFTTPPVTYATVIPFFTAISYNTAIISIFILISWILLYRIIYRANPSNTNNPNNPNNSNNLNATNEPNNTNNPNNLNNSNNTNDPNNPNNTNNTNNANNANNPDAPNNPDNPNDPNNTNNPNDSNNTNNTNNPNNVNNVFIEILLNILSITILILFVFSRFKFGEILFSGMITMSDLLWPSVINFVITIILIAAVITYVISLYPREYAHRGSMTTNFYNFLSLVLLIMLANNFVIGMRSYIINYLIPVLLTLVYLSVIMVYILLPNIQNNPIILRFGSSRQVSISTTHRIVRIVRLIVAFAPILFIWGNISIYYPFIIFTTFAIIELIRQDFMENNLELLTTIASLIGVLIITLPPKFLLDISGFFLR